VFIGRGDGTVGLDFELSVRVWRRVAASAWAQRGSPRVDAVIGTVRKLSTAR